MTEPLFDSVHKALTFAYNYTDSTLDRPLVNRLADKYKPTGKGLVGQDGAGQAGMIHRRLKELSRLHQAILYARFAPRDEPCPCCKNRRPRLEWIAAIRTISDAAIASALPGRISHRVLRDGLVARYFGQKVHLQTLAAECGVHRDTASEHNSLIVQWLHGNKLRMKGGDVVRQAKVGEEQRALAAAEGAIERLLVDLHVIS